IDIGKIGEFERRLLADIKTSSPGIVEAIAKEQAISGDTEKKLIAFLDGFAKTFA
ncbi:MAG: atpA, partial [Rhodospirillales bacterium]|nr:atpA [Rhodospirillales bacterium]